MYMYKHIFTYIKMHIRVSTDVLGVGRPEPPAPVGGVSGRRTRLQQTSNLPKNHTTHKHKSSPHREIVK